MVNCLTRLKFEKTKTKEKEKEKKRKVHFSFCKRCLPKYIYIYIHSDILIISKQMIFTSSSFSPFPNFSDELFYSVFFFSFGGWFGLG